MSLLLRRFTPRHLNNVYKVLSVDKANVSHWYPDLKPGPYPKTKEEREAAARKYNLLPEEYEPYPEDGDFVCDYPNLPKESVDAQDPWYPWDDDELRKNFGQPVPSNYINLMPEISTTVPEWPVSHKKGALYFLLLSGSTLGVIYFFHQFVIMQPILEEQKVTEGVTHYTFELDKKEK